MNDLTHLSAKSLATAISSKQVSAKEATEAYLSRINEVNPALNAVVQLDTENALAQAAKADDTPLEQRGPLHGVPMAIKDNLDTAGVITTGGTQGRANFIPQVDATVVKRLREAGAILLGKTNTPELTLSFETDNLVYGRTNNPYDLERTCGGSSGGAAAIVAAGGAAFDIGSDTGGSIRLPSHFCGIAGIRPTSGRTPRTGHILPPFGALESLTQLGPMARGVEDLNLILSLISGPDGDDPFVVDVPLREPDTVELGQLRIAFHTDNGIAVPIDAIQTSVQACVKTLAKTGASTTEVVPEPVQFATELYNALMLGDGGAGVKRLLEKAGTKQAYPDIAAMLSNAPQYQLTAAQFGEVIESVDIYRSRMLAFMDNYDAIISPVNTHTAVPHGWVGTHFADFSYTYAYNLTGWPGVVVRVGEDAQGLPIGVQVIAKPWREDVALKIASFLEAEFGGWQPPPL
ncbi:MAG: amidase [Pseudomonadota bacterium]